jgi:hypothetical protein
MDKYAVIWIDTDGKFKIEGCEHYEDANEFANVLSDSGLPVQVISRGGLIRGHFVVK